MEADDFLNILKRNGNEILPISNDKLVKFRYNKLEYCFLSIIDNPTTIVISIKQKNNREELTTSEFINIIRSKTSLWIPEEFKEHIFDRYKEVLFKIDGENGIGTSNYRIEEEETYFTISVA